MAKRTSDLSSMDDNMSESSNYSPTSDRSNVIVLLLVILLGLQVWTNINLDSKLDNLTGNSALITAKGVTAGTNTEPVPSPAPTPAPAADDLAKNVTKVSATDYIRGNKDAEISVIEYSDFECPFCKNVHPTLQQLVDTGNGKVNWVYRHYPLSFHPNAKPMAIASECAAKLGGGDSFWKYADKLMAGTATSDPTQLTAYAKEIGLNETNFKGCLSSNDFAKKIDASIAEGSQAGVSGTPGNIVLNNKTGKAVSVAGAQPIESFNQAILQVQ